MIVVLEASLREGRAKPWGLNISYPISRKSSIETLSYIKEVKY